MGSDRNGLLLITWLHVLHGHARLLLQNYCLLSVLHTAYAAAENAASDGHGYPDNEPNEPTHNQGEKSLDDQSDANQDQNCTRDAQRILAAIIRAIVARDHHFRSVRTRMRTSVLVVQFLELLGG